MEKFFIKKGLIGKHVYVKILKRRMPSGICLINKPIIQKSPEKFIKGWLKVTAVEVSS